MHNSMLNLNGSDILVYNQYKFLGVIQYFKEKCSKTLNLLRVIANKD